MLEDAIEAERTERAEEDPAQLKTMRPASAP
jgi:hypothetical protein